jgi:hypothetical protein
MEMIFGPDMVERIAVGFLIVVGAPWLICKLLGWLLEDHVEEEVPKAAPSAAELEEIERTYVLYSEGGAQLPQAPRAVYADDTCPHPGCGQQMWAIDFGVQAYGPAVRDPLVRAWWADEGFAGRCPKCSAWVHFTIRDKRAVSADEAAQLPQLPDGWSDGALFFDG